MNEGGPGAKDKAAPASDAPAPPAARKVLPRIRAGLGARFRNLSRRTTRVLIPAFVAFGVGFSGVLWFAMRDDISGWRPGWAGSRHGGDGAYAATDTGTDAVRDASTRVSQDQQPFHWKDNDDTLYRTTVDAERYRRFSTAQLQSIATRRADSINSFDERLRKELRPVLTGIEQRVTDYGDWMYNWWTAWILLGQAFAWTWQGMFDGELMRLPDVVQRKLGDEVREQYDTIVLRPEVLELQMQAILDQSIAVVQREILDICSQHDDTLRSFIRLESGPVQRFDATAGWVDASSGQDAAKSINVASICRSADVTGGWGLVKELLADKPMGALDAGVNDVIIRLSRPFATKLISFMVLPIAATAVAGGVALPFVGLAGGVLAGVLAGGAASALIIGFSASAAVDWLLTRADEAVSREEFETNLRRAVNVAATRFEDRVSRALKKYVGDRYELVTSTILGKKP